MLFIQTIFLYVLLQRIPRKFKQNHNLTLANTSQTQHKACSSKLILRLIANSAYKKKIFLKILKNNKGTLLDSAHKAGTYTRNQLVSFSLPPRICSFSENLKINPSKLNGTSHSNQLNQSIFMDQSIFHSHSYQLDQSISIGWYFFSLFLTFCMQTVETLIRCCILRHLIWVCIVCLCPSKRTLYRLIWVNDSRFRCIKNWPFTCRWKSIKNFDISAL